MLQINYIAIVTLGSLARWYFRKRRALLNTLADTLGTSSDDATLLEKELLEGRIV